MPTLLVDMTEETSASDASQLDAMIRLLGRTRRTVETQQDFGPDTIETIRFATGYALIRLHLVEFLWESAMGALRKKMTGPDAQRIIRTHLHLFESGQELVRMILPLWTMVEQKGGTPERLDDLKRAEGRLEELVTEAKRALAHRTQQWQPSDVDGLVRGLQLASDGKTVKAEEARAWFRQPRG